jgi:hypothetical protein
MNIESNIITNVLKLLNDIDITDKICNDELNYIKSFLSKIKKQMDELDKLDELKIYLLGSVNNINIIIKRLKIFNSCCIKINPLIFKYLNNYIKNINEKYKLEEENSTENEVSKAFYNLYKLYKRKQQDKEDVKEYEDAIKKIQLFIRKYLKNPVYKQKKIEENIIRDLESRAKANSILQTMTPKTDLQKENISLRKLKTNKPSIDETLVNKILYDIKKLEIRTDLQKIFTNLKIKDSLLNIAKKEKELADKEKRKIKSSSIINLKKKINKKKQSI